MELQFGNLTSNRTECVEYVSLLDTKQKYYVIVIKTTIKASSNHMSAFFQAFVASSVPFLKVFHVARMFNAFKTEQIRETPCFCWSSG